jgi:intracellular sulfur oxidation DsrE/DsrF family protein
MSVAVLEDRKPGSLSFSCPWEDMLPGIGYVPGGIIEILDRQSEGWCYIKAD